MSEQKKSDLAKDLVDFLKKSFHTPSSSANRMLLIWMQLGRVTKKEGNRLELAEVDR